MGREIELRRHTDADDDVLTADGVRAALAIGARLRGDYDLAVSTGAQRATQTLACFLAALAQQVPGGVVVEPGLRSGVEDRWRSAYQVARSGALPALREADRELVAEDSERLGAALRRVLDNLPDGGRALVVGHSPTNEAAVLGASRTGGPLDPVRYAATLRLALKRATVDKPMRPFHDGRHTSITNAAAAGVAPAALMARAGHSDFKTTQGYIDLAGETFREEAALLEERLFGVAVREEEA